VEAQVDNNQTVWLKSNYTLWTTHCTTAAHQHNVGNMHSRADHSAAVSVLWLPSTVA